MRKPNPTPDEVSDGHERDLQNKWDAYSTRPAYTKGPWHVHSSSNGNVMIYETALSNSHQTKNMVDPMPICIMKSDEREGHNKYANADLIAACPEMFETLTETIKAIESQYVDGVPEWVRLIAQRSLSAITKARGEK